MGVTAGSIHFCGFRAGIMVHFQFLVLLSNSVLFKDGRNPNVAFRLEKNPPYLCPKNDSSHTLLLSQMFHDPNLLTELYYANTACGSLGAQKLFTWRPPQNHSYKWGEEYLWTPDGKKPNAARAGVIGPSANKRYSTRSKHAASPVNINQLL